MAATAQKFTAARDELASMLTQLMAQLDELQGSWRGQGATAFDTTRQRWNEDTAKLNRALGETAEAIAKAGTFYTNTDEGSAGRLGGIAGHVSLPL